MIATNTGKVALVIGGSRGIGAAVVRRLAGEGAKVAFTYASAVQSAEALASEIEAQGGAALAIAADSMDAGAIEAAVAATVAGFGRLDILVVNAGIVQQGRIDEMPLDDFDRMVAVNIRGVFAAIRAAAPHLPQGGRIVTMGSVVAVRTGFPGSSVYSMTKGAVASLVRGAAIDLAPRSITVNNIQPGPTTTALSAGHEETLTPLIPLGRLGTPEEIAAAVAWLASDEASFVTGASLTVDGGYVA